MTYGELCTTSNFTFLKGASHPEELVTRAAELGLSAIAITDQNSLAGVVRAYAALQEIKRSATEDITIRSTKQLDHSSRQVTQGASIARPDIEGQLPKLIVGTRLVLQDSTVHWVALPNDRKGYEALSRLLTVGKRRAPKGQCRLSHRDLLEGCLGMTLIAVPQKGYGDAADPIAEMARTYPSNVYLGCAPRYDGNDQASFDRCMALSHATSAPMVAIGDVLMHHGSRRQLADVLTCLREGCSIDDIGKRALPNAERRLKGEQDMARLFSNYPAAIKRTQDIIAKCSFCLSELSYEYPTEVANGETGQDRLVRLPILA